VRSIFVVAILFVTLDARVRSSRHVKAVLLLLRPLYELVEYAPFEALEGTLPIRSAILEINVIYLLYVFVLERSGMGQRLYFFFFSSSR